MTSREKAFMKFALRGLLPLAAVVALVALAVWAMEPPTPQPENAPPAVFSATRAMRYARAIARAPHPTGSAEQHRVRDYLVAQFQSLGVPVRVQRTLAWRDGGPFIRAAQVENIIARLPGQANNAEKAVMLCAHYDSHNTGPGAGDDGAGVAALLETARALRAKGAARSVLFVVTDAEEAGLIGAEGFVRDAPEAKEVSAVLNFEARGGGGPVFMFETSDDNVSLIEKFARSAPHPVASSLMYALYKQLPNDTDLSVYKKAGMLGLNFAFASQWTYYHTQLDTPDGLDLRSLQQQGDAALALAQTMQDAGPVSSSESAAYFDILGRFLVWYPLGLQIPLVAVALCILVVARLRARGDANFGQGFGFGLLVFPLTFVLGAFAAVGFCLAIAPLRAQTPWSDPYDARLLEGALFAVVGGMLWGVWSLLPTRYTARPLLLGALCWWAVLLVLVTLALPGAAYLFLGPLLLSSTALLPRRDGHRVFALVAALASLLLTIPVVHGICLLTGFGMPPALGILSALTVAPLIPLVRLSTTGQRILAPMILLVGGLLATGVAFTRNLPSSQRPHIDSLFYFLDADTKTAQWATTDAHPDKWTRQFLGNTPKPVPGTTFLPWSERTYLAAPTPPLSLPAPDVTRNGNQLTIRSRRGALELVIAGRGIRAAKLEGQTLPVAPGKPFCLRLLAPPTSGITLELDADAGAVLTVDDYSYRLPDGVPIRPADLIPAPLNPISDQTIVRTRVRL